MPKKLTRVQLGKCLVPGLALIDRLNNCTKNEKGGSIVGMAVMAKPKVSMPVAGLSGSYLFCEQKLDMVLKLNILHGM